MIEKIKIWIDSRFYRSIVIVYLVFVSLIIFFSVNIGGILFSFTNISDLMSPEINQGSITLVTKSNDYQIGDIVSYYSLINNKEEIVIHRITGIGGNVYTTKGDANNVADRELVMPRHIIGKVILVIPLLRHLIAFAKSYLGTWLLIIFPAAIIIFSELTRIYLQVEKTSLEKDA